jgi:hypothetical protein
MSIILYKIVLFIYSFAGRQQDAQACYERALQMTPNNLSIHQDFIRSLMDIGQVNVAFRHTSGLLADKSVNLVVKPLPEVIFLKGT